MKKIDFNRAWLFRRVGDTGPGEQVDLPHDAMLRETRSDLSSGGANISWFQGGDYEYIKTFDWPAAAEGVDTAGRVLLDFEGVYQKAEVYLNGEKIVYRPYGYTNFYADLTGRLKAGENTIRVRADNSQQPNSRWYTGSGIYRPVTLCLLPERYILPDSIRITTLDYRLPTIRVEAEVSRQGTVEVDILPDGGGAPFYHTSAECDGRIDLTFTLPSAKLWSPETPMLYRCRVTCGQDAEEVIFGIRVVECDAKQGLRINGERVILRGACIHHDNGVLGAVAEPFAENRKVRLLKEAGYNALRSAHNPCSRALLEACDRQGMLMMDEYVDMWYIHKTKYDYADYFDQWWREDIADMVRKDYNHPSVILYSIGNEVSETGQKRGIALTGEMREHIRTMDVTRPVSCGVNIFFNYLSSLGFGVYSDKKAEKTEISGKSSKMKAVGSEFFNNLAGLMGAGFMKFGATLHGSNVKTRDSFAKLDVAGYNYGIDRYRHDLKQYPSRVILGSETFCADAYRFWELAKVNPAIIGDFVWAGMDYLGEAGIGSWEYLDYAPDFDHGAGWITAGSGRLDITGRGSGEMLYTQVAFELRDIGMAVVPVHPTKRRHSPSAWKFSNAIPSWSWHGLDGSTATVEVYARAPRVTLHLNGKQVGEKKWHGNCRFTFRVPYHDGLLEAKAYDESGKCFAQTQLRTANQDTILHLIPEQRMIAPDDLAYIRILLGDDQGELHPRARGRIKVQVENGTLLGLGHGCPYNAESYLDDTTSTYYGEALAVIRPSGTGDVVVKATSPFGNAETILRVQD